MTNKLLTAAQRTKLLENGNRQRATIDTDREPIDFYPVVKLFTPDANATWLLTELVPEDPDLAFGLCDLGVGFPELGYVRLSELEQLRGPLRLPVERDRHFTASQTISQYAEAARTAERIIT
jgi:Protein of unknown function (DUF2958)